jgi:N-acetylglucosamine kinase
MPETADGTLYAANVPAASGSRCARSERPAGREVRLDNDANCFALSEAWDDEFTQYPLVMGLILGTGVGGGLVFNGKSITGHSYITGEFGHIRLPVDALEVVGVISRSPAAAAASWAALKTISPAAVLPGCMNIFINNPHLAGDRGAVAAGRCAGAEHVERYLDLLAVCLGNILTIVDPDLLVLGGGLSNFTAISEGLAQRLPRHFFRLPGYRVLNARATAMPEECAVRPSFMTH